MACQAAALATSLALNALPLRSATLTVASHERPVRKLAATARRHRRPGVHHRGPTLEKAKFPDVFTAAPAEPKPSPQPTTTPTQPTTATAQVQQKQKQQQQLQEEEEGMEVEVGWMDKAKGQMFWLFRTLGTVID